MRRTRSAASALGIPAAVTNSGRTGDPRTTGTAWAAVQNLDLATPITGMPNPACAGLHVLRMPDLNLRQASGPCSGSGPHGPAASGPPGHET